MADDIDGWCDEIVERLGPRGVRSCRRRATQKFFGKQFCTFHANRFAPPAVAGLFEQARVTVEPRIDAEREAEAIGQDVMHFRMGEP